MAPIYEQHAAAFSQVSAYVILKGADMVATVAFKHPRDGAGRLYAYAHWIGMEMVRGYASGGGYDKASAACADAARKAGPMGVTVEATAFRNALAKDDGHRWDRNLEQAGFTVLQAV